jgi:hypothetical protein
MSRMSTRQTLGSYQERLILKSSCASKNLGQSGAIGEHHRPRTSPIPRYSSHHERLLLFPCAMPCVTPKNCTQHINQVFTDYRFDRPIQQTFVPFMLAVLSHNSQTVCYVIVACQQSPWAGALQTRSHPTRTGPQAPTLLRTQGSLHLSHFSAAISRNSVVGMQVLESVSKADR